MIFNNSSQLSFVPNASICFGYSGVHILSLSLSNSFFKSLKIVLLSSSLLTLDTHLSSTNICLTHSPTLLYFNVVEKDIQSSANAIVLITLIAFLIPADGISHSLECIN
jgi:hypothetical protein